MWRKNCNHYNQIIKYIWFVSFNSKPVIISDTKCLCSVALHLQTAQAVIVCWVGAEWSGAEDLAFLTWHPIPYTMHFFWQKPYAPWS